MATYKIHNVRFYKPKAKAIYCMTFNKQTKKLALSRSDASIEIWNLQENPTMEKCFPSSPKNFSIEGLAWSGDRLFSVGLQALLNEYNLKQLKIKSQTSVTGQTAFCLDVNKQNTHIAIGTEQGYLNIFSIAENEVVFEKFLDKQDGRILCLKYDATGTYIASGSLDTIRLWNVQTGHAIHKMTTGRSAANKATIVWCINITENLTIITGDSRGKLSFWDGKVGAQTESYQSHRADILSLCLSEDENELHCAGIDTNITCYKNIAVRGDNHKWVKSVVRKVHDHDVRALVVHGKYLFSGGVDGYLACSYYPPRTLVKYSPVALHPQNCVEIAAKARCILLKYPKSLELWSMGEEAACKGKENIGNVVPIKKQPKKLLVLQRQVKTDLGEKREGILTSAISSCGEYIAFSTCSILRLYKFDYIEDEEPDLTQCDLPFENPCVNMIFLQSDNQLIVAPQEGGLVVLQIIGDHATTIQTISTEVYIKDTITFLNISPCGKYLVVADPESNIAVWKQNESWEFYFKLPRYTSSPTGMSIHPNTQNLLISYTDHSLSEFNLVGCKLTDFSLDKPEGYDKMFTKHFPIRNILHCPSGGIVLLHDDSNIHVISKKKDVNPKSPKVAKIISKKHKDDTLMNIRSIKKYKHLIHLDFLSPKELVAVEVSPLTLLEPLPPGFKQNTFGTK